MASILVIGNAKETFCLSSRLAQDAMVKTCILSDPSTPDWRKIYPEGLDLVIYADGAPEIVKERFHSVPSIGGLTVLSDPELALKAATLLMPDLVWPEVVWPNGKSFLIGSFFNQDGFFGRHLMAVQWRLMEGEKGPLTPGVGAVAFPLEESPHYMILDHLIPLLERAKYIGPIWIEVILDTVSNKLFWVKYITNLTFVGFFAFSALCRRGPVQFLLDLALRHKPALYTNTCGGAIRLSLSPWPIGEFYDKPATPRVDFNPAGSRHIWFADESETLGFVTARGDDTHEVRRRLYRTLNNSCDPAVQYRRDIGQNLWLEEYIRGNIMD